MELFEKCDADASGLIDLYEFVNHYADTSNQLQARRGELKKDLIHDMKNLTTLNIQLQSNP